MRILDNMESCYGCGACFNACPTGAVSMKENVEGFMEPVIDAEKCIACGKCRQVCPSVNCQYPNNPEPDIYAFSAEEKLLYDSSSGGIFTFLAENVLKKGGYVAGAAYDDKFRVNHIIIHDIEELDLLRRSKYLQSSTGDTFQRVKELLEEGRYVLYSGWPDCCVFWERIMISCIRWMSCVMEFLPRSCFRNIYAIHMEVLRRLRMLSSEAGRDGGLYSG